MNSSNGEKLLDMAQAPASALQEETENQPTCLPTTFIEIRNEGDGSNIPTTETTITIRISEPEKQLIQLLEKVAELYNNKIVDGGSSQLIVRIAGGWVRDKVLGHPYDQDTNDIDVAIDKISGVQFAELVQSYLLMQSEAATDDSGANSSNQSTLPMNPNMHKMGIIAANPEQSKHLETACMKLYEIDCDFTNLRCHEVYSSPDNRIPDTTIQFGTPHSDAHRRDFTVNSLFFNIQTRMIEDYTTRGLPNLRNRYLQTPLDPQVTFFDDPLRILRAIRFAIRFQLTMDDRIVAAAQDRSIQMALQNKVSRERVGKELEGMISGKCANPIAALRTIHRLHLSSSIFVLPTVGIHCNSVYGTFLGTMYLLTAENFESHSTILNIWDDSLGLLSVLSTVSEQLVARQPGTELNSKYIMEDGRIDKRLLPLAVYLFPLFQLQYLELPKNTAATPKECHVVAFIVKESIKFKNTDVQAMSSILRNVESMTELLRLYSNNGFAKELTGETKYTDIRLKVGTILFDVKELWSTLLLLAVVVLIRQKSTNADPAVGDCDDWLRTCNTIYNDVLYKFELDNCWNTIRPIMNGQELIRELQLPKGPTVGWYMAEQMNYLIRFPTSTKPECLKYLQELDSSAISLSLDMKATNKKKKAKT